MENRIDESLVKKVAKLARLELTETEVKEFTVQLAEILEYVQKLNELDTEKIEPLAHCLAISNCFREDKVRPSMGTEKAMENAPQRDEDFFKVPKILDESI